MSTRRAGALANVLGRSVAARVVRLAQVPVTIVKSRPPATSAVERFRFFSWAR